MVTFVSFHWKTLCIRKRVPIWGMGAAYQLDQTGFSMYQSEVSEALILAPQAVSIILMFQKHQYHISLMLVPLAASIILMYQSHQRGVIMWPSCFGNEPVGGGRFSTCGNNIIKESCSIPMDKSWAYSLITFKMVNLECLSPMPQFLKDHPSG